MIPTSTHEKMSHNFWPWLVSDVSAKKAVMQFDDAVECRIADNMIHAAASENAAVTERQCKVT
jgi:hypothetical protein